MLAGKSIVSALVFGLLLSGLQAKTLRDVLGENLGQNNEGVSRLDLSNKGITEITQREAQDLVKNYPNLRDLDLRGNELREIPGAMLGGLTQLETLVLMGNKLVKLPEEIGRLKNLRTLELSYNMLTRLPDTINLLKRLEALSLSANKLQGVPRSISALSKLRKLWLDGNELTAIPVFIPRAMKDLVYLHVEGNFLRGENINRLVKPGMELHVGFQKDPVTGES